MKSIFIMSIITLSFLFGGCNQAKKNQVAEQAAKADPVEASKASTIYEVNIRQYTPEGTIEAFMQHIPRLKELGVDILWIMPIYPIGEKNKKGPLGSYYAVKDYKDVNPEFGTKDDFKKLVKTVHDNDMMIILDWVANHTAWDHPWIKKHPEWYTKDSTGDVVAPVEDWTDVADLNYENQEMRQAMTDALVYWVKEFNVDGYRCDVASMVPNDFWESARTEMEKVKPVFMLAEAEKPELHKMAFDANYAWELHHIMNEIAKGKQNASHLRKYFKKEPTRFADSVYRMAFTTNHDENSWNGTVFERMPNSYKTFAVFTYAAPTFPLIYSGQEAGLNKRLAFFKKDTIEWKEHEMGALYKKLNTLKEDNPALWNGRYGGKINVLKTNHSKQIFAFTREKEDNKVLAIFNLSDTAAEVKFKNFKPAQSFKDAFTGKEFDGKTSIKLEPWDYFIGLK
ncbi:Alpha-amylase 2 [Salinivirga cyanobacteriivorans]|uniref:Alpha-amylase 2 n=1 Tax=Salinivirga cyanobacteriivorans TaxID=1307839 RepID=A0A0S2I2C5_9BACT|nr:alpha-amylase family glycosyl hydrolase [Salinivirga cyanobacteriivorans]ALO16391.1 Alpha-amylase 2 [Salinivirga cyanobacteriivorans]